MKRFILNYKNKTYSQSLQIFHPIFVRNNKIKSKIIYRNKILSLTDKIQNLDGAVKIKLLILDTNGLNLKKMFCDCKSLIKMLDASEDINKINYQSYFEDKLLSNILNGNSMINNYYYFRLNLLDSSPKLNKIKVINLSYMFYGCSSLISLPDLSLWDTNKNIDINNIFKDCSSLISIPDISNWKIDKVNDMNNIFCGCSSLVSLPDISNWNTYKVTNISNMFNGCSSLISLPDISKWNTNNVINLSGMFYKCSSLKIMPDISIWNCSNFKDISRMFGFCTSLYFLPYILRWNFDNLEEVDDITEGLKMLDSNIGNAILRGEYGIAKSKIYNDLLTTLNSQYPKSIWFFVEPQNDSNNSRKNLFTFNFNNCNIIKAIYKIKENKEKIKIFNHDFIRKNKYKFKIIYKNKIYPPNYENSLSDINNKAFNLKFILFNKISIDNNNDINEYIESVKYHENKTFNRNLSNYEIFPSNLKNLIDEYQYPIQLCANQYYKINLNNYISYVNPLLYTYYNLLYKNEPNKERIKIFGEKFVHNNKDKCIIICNDIILPLQEYLSINNNDHFFINKNDSRIKILLIELENIKNKSYMFHDCVALEQFSILKDKKEAEVKCFNIERKEENSSSSINDSIHSDFEGDKLSSIQKNTFITSKEHFPYFINSTNFEKQATELTDLSFMFYNCESLLSIKDISNWNVKNVTNIAEMFFGCESLLSMPDISNWNIENVVNISSLFTGCSSLKLLPDISKWNTTSVKNMNCLFFECTSLFSIPDISKWNTKNCRDMNYLFSNCSSLMSLPDISEWNIENISDITRMFDGCSSLISIPDISKWNISKKYKLSRLFNNCKSLRYLPDISKWKTNSLTDISFMFNGCSSLISLPDMSKWNTNEFINISNLFCGCESLISLPDLSKWNIKNISNINNIFSGCKSLISIPDISNWNINNAVEMNNIFEGCSSLISIPDITKWNISKTINISGMFTKCFSLISIPDIYKSNFSTVDNKEIIINDDCLSLINLPYLKK